ncbi:MAG: hypothetical protein AAF617_02780 [Bacteroidota bacterium]
MLKNILKIDGVSELTKKEQNGISGGSGIDPFLCISCGGIPIPNDDCFIAAENIPCLSGGGIDD